MRIAVIGSGIAGLATAWLLTQPEGDSKAQGEHAHVKHDVTLFERSARLGMDASGVDVDLNALRAAKRDGSAVTGATSNPANGDANAKGKGGGEQKVRIDVPLRVFTESYYPNLSNLYREVGVGISPEDYASSFSELNGPAIFAYSNLLWGKRSIPFPSPSRWTDTTYWRILFETLRFLWTSPQHLQSGSLRGITFAQYVAREKYSADWVERFALPALAGIGTCSFGAVRAYPAQIIVHYVLTRSMFGVRRACGGTEQVVESLSKGATVRCSANVKHIETLPDGKGVRLTMGDGSVEDFDHVVLATQANQALALLKNPSAEVKAALSGFEYEKSRLVLHTDPALMPRDRAQWRSVNFILEPANANAKCNGDAKDTAAAASAAAGSGRANGNGNAAASQTAGKGDYSADGWAAATAATHAGAHVHNRCTAISGEGMATIWMNRVHHALYGVTDVDIFQTWNPIVAPRPGTVLCGGEFERPVVTFGSVAAIRSLWEQQGTGRVWFVGSYSLYGMPLLETAVSSAIQVAARLGCACPWGDRVKQHEVLAAGAAAATPKTRSVAASAVTGAVGEEADAANLDALEHLKLPRLSRVRYIVQWLPRVLLLALVVFVVTRFRGKH